MIKCNDDDPPLYLGNNKDLSVYINSKEIVVNFFNNERRIKIDQSDPNPLETARKIHEELMELLIAYRYGTVAKLTEPSSSAQPLFTAEFNTTSNKKMEPTSKLYKLYYRFFEAIRKYTKSKR